MNTNITIGILIFEEAEELDFVGPYEVFGMAAEFEAQCRTVVIAESLEAVRCAHGMRVLPDYTIEQCTCSRPLTCSRRPRRSCPRAEESANSPIR